MLRLFESSQRNKLEIHPATLQMITRDLAAIDNHLVLIQRQTKCFFNILLSKNDPETTLRLNESGVLGRFVTDFGRVVAQMQYDMYHVYTTDEHTIRAIGILSRLETGALASDHPLESKVVQEISLLSFYIWRHCCNDIAKEEGATILN